MTSILLISACIALIAYRIYKYMFYKPDNFPPGPPRLPFFGSYLFLLLVNYKHLHKAVEILCKYYKTDILGLYIADTPTIVAHTTESAKLCLTHRDFDGKPQLLIAKMRDPDFKFRGIFFTEGEQWHEQRRFFLRYFREYGFGRRFDELELDINEDIKDLIDLLKNGPKFSHENKFMKDGNVLCPHIFHAVVFNGFIKVLLNERFLRAEQKILFDAGELSYQFLTKTDDWGLMFSIVPEFATLFPGYSGYTELKEITEKLYSIVKNILDERFNTFDSNHVRHFLDLYFKEMEKSGFDENVSFNYKQLILSCVDFFTPGLNATAITLQFLVQRICLQPDLLKKIRAEIDNVVGQGRLPQLDDRINLPYTEATLREIMRYETLVPSGLPHKALKDTTFMGYNIPQGSNIFSSLYACHKDPLAWESHDEFRPERFLDDRGKLSLKKDVSLPFGAGKRLCAAETFSRNILFLVSSAIFQNFNIECPVEHRVPDLSETRTGTPRSPPPFWIRFTPRT